MKYDIRAIIFGADGTILDTRELMYQSFEHSLAIHGHPSPHRSQISIPPGYTLEDSYRALMPEADHNALSDTHRAFQKNNFHLVVGYEGVREILQKIQDAGIKIGLCTSRGEHVIQLLKNVGIRDYFQSVVRVDMVSKHKPDPESVLKTLEELNVAPGHAVMVGDTSVDIAAGKAAGVAFTVAITHGFEEKESLRKTEPDYVVDHLNDIPPLILPN